MDFIGENYMLVTKHGYKETILNRLAEIKNTLDSDYAKAQEILLKERNTIDLITCGEMHLQARHAINQNILEFTRKF